MAFIMLTNQGVCLVHLETEFLIQTDPNHLFYEKSFLCQFMSMEYMVW